MGYINTVQINGGSQYLIEPTLFTTVTDNVETAVLNGTIPNFELTPGVVITVIMTCSNKASATLSINNDTEKAIYYQGAAIEANVLKQGHIYNLVYDGTVWHVIGTRHSNNEMVLPHKLTFGAGGAYEYDGSADVTIPVYTGTLI